MYTCIVRKQSVCTTHVCTHDKLTRYINVHTLQTPPPRAAATVVRIGRKDGANGISAAS